MKKWLIPLSSAAPASLVGRKAAALGKLIEAGFPVPTGWCITTDAFQAAAATWPDDLRLPQGLLDELTSTLAMDKALAVRSSAEMEDLPEASLAGRYTTHLNVSGADALEQAVLGCWRSYLTAPAGSGGMAVLIQPMLDADCAGVCFTVDPVRLRPDLLLVVSAWGLGAGVVSGSIPTDTARLRRMDLQVEDASIAEKHTALRRAVSGGGVMPAAVAEELREIPCLPESWLERVGQFGLAIEQVFGTPQDVEWAIAQGQVWILQSRPVTALPVETRAAVRYPIDWIDGEESGRYWWLERARNDAGTPLLPAEIDFMRINMQGGQDSVYNGGSADTRWRKYVNGRVYMAKAKSPHPPGHVRVYGAANRDLHERLVQQGITWWEYWGPEIVRATDRLTAFDAREADGSALAEHLEDAIAAAQRHWMVHTIVPGRPIRSAALLESYAQITGRPTGELAADLPFLLSGSETVQTRLVEALYQLACLAMASPEVAKAFVVSYQADGLLESQRREYFTQDAADFAAAFQRLIAEYGDRLCYRAVPGYPVEMQLTWREAPEHVWELVAAYLPLARRGGPGPRETRLETQLAADQRIEALSATALAAGIDPARVEEFRGKLAYARRNAAYLDEHNHYIDQLSEGQYVQALLYAGRWLAAQGCLPGPFDVFWLNADEVIAALREPQNGLEAVLAEHQAQFRAWQAALPPACLGLPDPHLPDRPADAPHAAALTEVSSAMHANVLTGEPASRGRASGRARLIDGNALPAGTVRDDVLIAPYASQLLIPLLPAVTALVLDYGGPGDHFAITAREFGLPSVCATLHATRRIPEGAWVTVDADAGLVSWVSH